MPRSRGATASPAVAARSTNTHARALICAGMEWLLVRKRVCLRVLFARVLARVCAMPNGRRDGTGPALALGRRWPAGAVGRAGMALARHGMALALAWHWHGAGPALAWRWAGAGMALGRHGMALGRRWPAGAVGRASDTAETAALAAVALASPSHARACTESALSNHS
jgi:hypothetical protein